MRKSRIFSTPESFGKEFLRCCGEYASLHVAVAWCGDPGKTLPYKHLETFKGSVVATVGTAFNHTHPDAIEWFEHIRAYIRIFDSRLELFHPKVYMFTSGNRYAIFAGSSNLTYGGFYTNVEINALIEGTSGKGKQNDVRNLKQCLSQWHSDTHSFVPTQEWLNRYRRAYEANARKERKNAIRTPPRAEEDISTASWLRNADWSIYYTKVVEGLEQHERSGQGYHDVLDAAERELPVPWRIANFDDIEKRRIIGGIKAYGWLGHVAASGQFRHLLAGGSTEQHRIIVRAVNRMAGFTLPID